MTGTKDRFGGPRWWHQHGMKVDVIRPGENAFTVSSRSSVAYVQIVRMPTNEEWFVHWGIKLGPLGQEVKGCLLFTKEQLQAAFGISDEAESHTFLLEHYGADVAEQGLYIREGKFLNIPSPGTSLDGDPNISIYITPEITGAVKNFLENSYVFGSAA